jgi:hypothetical protein
MSEQPYRPLITRSIVDQGQFELTDIANAEVGKPIEEFDTAVNDAISSVGFAIAGFSYLRDHCTAVRERTGANNPGINLTTSDEGVGFYARWTVSEILEKTRLDGLAAGQLGAQLIVFLYTLWEDGFRMSFAKAHGCEARDFQVPVLGDLKLMRHDIIHHRSVASSENTGRCQVLRWFKPGEVIRPGASQFFDLVTHFPWEILATGPNASSDLSRTTAEDSDAP